jgi:hypothetical protein
VNIVNYLLLLWICASDLTFRHYPLRILLFVAGPTFESLALLRMPDGHRSQALRGHRPLSGDPATPHSMLKTRFIRCRIGDWLECYISQNSLLVVLQHLAGE